MQDTLKRAAKATLKPLNLGISRLNTLEQCKQNNLAMHDIQVLQRLNTDHAKQLLTYYGKSRAQLRQDLFVLSHLDFKSNGYFVEFGATNGVDLSNSYLLEKEFSMHHRNARALSPSRIPVAAVRRT